MGKLTPAYATPLETLGEVNDLGKPWRYEDDGLTVTRLSPWSAPGCHPVGCGLKVYTNDDGKIVKVEGDENNPITQGRLCVRCITLQDYIYNPSRIIHPMIRDPKYRGQADKWEVVSWDEACAYIKKYYDATVEKYGHKAITTFSGTGREGGTFPYSQLMLGTCNSCYTQSGYACYIPRLAASAYLTGAPYPEIDFAAAFEKRYEDPAFTVPEVIVLWGKMPLASNPDGFFGHSVVDLARRGARIISIDPRMNWITSRADIHLRLRAGTDAALGLAMLYIIINENLYDEDFVSRWCFGFDKLVERVNDPEKGVTPEQAAEICQIPVELIYKAARMYATAKPAAIAWGLAIDQKANGMQAGQCIIDLEAITGNIDVPGGNIIGDVNAGLGESGFGENFAPTRDMSIRIGLHDYPAYSQLVGTTHADMTLKTLETEEPYPLRFGFYMGNNLVSCTSAEPKRWQDAILKQLDFCFALEAFMTASVQATCDCVLPLAASAERDGTTYCHYGAMAGVKGFSQKATTTGEAMTDYEACWYVGRYLNPTWWEKYPTVDDLINHLRLSNNYDFREEAKNVYTRDVMYYRKYELGRLRNDGAVGFNTPTGRVELYSNVFAMYGEDPLPYYIEPQYSPVNTPELAEEYPLVLTTGARTYAFFHSENRQIPYCRELNPDPLFEIHPETAKKYGIVDGQWCEISNQFGKAILKAKVSYIVDEKTIHAQHGWWFPEEDGNDHGYGAYGTFRSNINNLVPNFHFGKLGFGAPFKCLLCKVTPLAENYDTDMKLVWEKFKREDQ